MKFFTSRYTASLEEQVRELKAEVLRLQLLNTELAQRILVAQPAPVQKAVAPQDDKGKKELPRAGNWLQTKAALEGNWDISEELPDKETANGSR